jgi:hypothetical protein
MPLTRSKKTAKTLIFDGLISTSDADLLGADLKPQIEENNSVRR